jgi:hypothetical protein
MGTKPNSYAGWSYWGIAQKRKGLKKQNFLII